MCIIVCHLCLCTILLHFFAISLCEHEQCIKRWSIVSSSSQVLTGHIFMVTKQLHLTTHQQYYIMNIFWNVFCVYVFNTLYTFSYCEIFMFRNTSMFTFIYFLINKRSHFVSSPLSLPLFFFFPVFNSCIQSAPVFMACVTFLQKAIFGLLTSLIATSPPSSFGLYKCAHVVISLLLPQRNRTHVY